MTMMISWRAWVLGAAVMSGLQVASAAPVGFVAASEGDVSLMRGDQSSWSLALVDQEVEIGDTARTARDSALKLILVDDTTLTLGEETEVVIDELLVGPAALREVSVLRQLSGKLRVRVGEAFGGTTRLQVHTPTAVMGVKGSQFTSWVKHEQGAVHTLVCNTGGEVWVVAARDAAGQREPIGFGKCRRVSEAGAVGPEISISDEVFPLEPRSGGLEDMLALAGSEAAYELLVPALVREELPAVGVAGGAKPFRSEREVEPLFEDSADTFRGPAARVTGFTTAPTPPALPQPGTNIVPTPPALGQP